MTKVTVIQLNESGLVYENQPISTDFFISWDVGWEKKTVSFW